MTQRGKLIYILTINLQYFWRAVRRFNYANTRGGSAISPAYSDNSSLVRSNLLPRVCIDAAAKPRTACCFTSKIQYAELLGEPLGEPIFIVGSEPPCLASQMQRGKRLANAILARIRVKACGYAPDFPVRAKRPYRCAAPLHSVCS